MSEPEAPTPTPTPTPTLAQQLRQGLAGGLKGLQRLRNAAQLERELKAQYIHLGQLYTEQRPESELQVLREHILELQTLKSTLSTPPVPHKAKTTPAPLPTPAEPAALPEHLAVTGMAARIWQAKEEERDEDG